MAISVEEVLRTANLANLKLDKEDIDASITDMETFISFCDQLREVDVTDVLPTVSTVAFKNATRADNILPSLDKNEVLKNAPEHSKNGFSVPKILE